ncbi:MAG: AsmA family protein [gamma proteobacterium symbiont of Lucinoma myriamae]|nr:AsmA family protein [gamma proteobacterium symbiont of Lucinoma myriamae]MCU7817515.1 AsmA family protein [gamma proteobacterium symbiont of Lucinoma myriamae]MCU7832775.1 AsmA family protein [gamma proteobacterium symbiont of Lucinoma myriamae]
MKKLFKSLFKVTSIVIIIFLILSVLVTVFVDINHYKTEITQIVEQETGLKLEINGELELRIFSGIKFSADDVKLFLDKELIADVESIRLGVSAYSFYYGEPEITSVDLTVRTLKLSRNKKGQLNFLPLYYKNLAASDSTNNDYNEDEKLPLNSLAIKDIQLSIEGFQYLDDLSSVSINLTNSNASLSLLPIIDHHELIIDDPRVLVAYNYEGELEIKKALIDQYQISNLAMHFTDQEGNFVADKLSFNLIEGGKKHAVPPIVVDAQGKLALKIRYHTPKGASEPLWAQPDIIKIGEFDFNLAKFELTDKQYQLKTEQTHLVFDEMSVFESKSYLLNELQIKSLSAESKNVIITLTHDNENIDKYELSKSLLQLNNVPVIHKGKPLDVMSDVFLKKLAKKGVIKLTSENIRYDSQLVEKINIALKGNTDKIDLLMSSSNVMDSSITVEGHFNVHPSTKKNTPQWHLKVFSDKLSLKAFSELTNTPFKIEGFSSIDTHLSGSYHDSNFQLTNGKVNTRADNLLLHGINLNKILEDFQSSQSVGLLDVGAVVLMGPTGMLLTKGKDYNNLLKTLGDKGTSKINQLSLNMTLYDDIVTMNDVAFSTQKHRLAVKGQINAKQKTFINFKAATINKDGCPIYVEEVKGTLDAPIIKKVNILVSGVVNPITSLVKKAGKRLNLQCKKPFYNGAVKAPL